VTTILAAVDASAAAQPVLDTATALGRTLRMPVVAIHVRQDGTADTSRAVEQTMGWFAGSGVEIVSLHVFDTTTVPRFWDRPEHDHAAWTREFLARNAPAAGIRLQVRSGWPSDRVLEVASAEGADMIALGWGRRLAPDRAAVVREVLTRTPVPLILLPRPA
jgi:nucleotide-binding universal stress UspA family protein